MYTYNPMIVILIPSSSWKREKFVLSWDNKGDLAALNVMAHSWTRALPSWLFYLACLTAVCHLYIVHYRRQPCFCCAFIEVVFISLYLRDLLKTLIHKKTLIWFMVFFKTNRNWLGWEQGLDTSLHPPKFKAIQLKASISYLRHKKTTIAVGKGHAACSGMGAAGSGKWSGGGQRDGPPVHIQSLPGSVRPPSAFSRCFFHLPLCFRASKWVFVHNVKPFLFWEIRRTNNSFKVLHSPLHIALLRDVPQTQAVLSSWFLRPSEVHITEDASALKDFISSTQPHAPTRLSHPACPPQASLQHPWFCGRFCNPLRLCWAPHDARGNHLSCGSGHLLFPL